MSINKSPGDFQDFQTPCIHSSQLGDGYSSATNSSCSNEVIASIKCPCLTATVKEITLLSSQNHSTSSFLSADV